MFEKSEKKVFALAAHCIQCLCGRVSRKRVSIKAVRTCVQKVAVFIEVKVLPQNADEITQLSFPGWT